MDRNAPIAVRPARLNDVAALSELEKRVWERLGHPPVESHLLTAWMEANPDGFLVAHEGASLCGYVYVETIDFDPNRIDDDAFTKVVASGHLAIHHQLNGNAFYGTSIVVDRPRRGIGKLLLEHVVARALREGKEYIVTFSRMPGCATFLECVASQGDATRLLQKEELAAWYARQCVELVGGECHPAVYVPSVPNAPLVQDTDPVLSFFTVVLGMSLWGVVPTPAPDPLSGDMAALMIRHCSQ